MAKKVITAMVHNHGGGYMGTSEPRVLPNSEFYKKYEVVGNAQPQAPTPLDLPGDTLVVNERPTASPAALPTPLPLPQMKF